MAKVFEIPLREQSQEYWENTILYRLAEALDYPRNAYNCFTVDPDELLDEAVEAIWRYRELEN